MSGAERIPVAVWSGTLFGLRVYVLDDGRRIVDADDLHKFLEGLASGDGPGFDLRDFGDEYAKFMRGESSQATSNAGDGQVPK